jgi:hypothetical protein
MSGFRSFERERAFLKGIAVRIPRLFVISLLSATMGSAHATSFTVSNANDSGAGSLRQAITDANADSNAPHTITISAPTSAGFNIQLLTPLPIVTRSLTLSSQQRSTLIRVPAGGFLRFSAIGGGSFSMTNIRVRQSALSSIPRGGCLRSDDASGVNAWTMRISSSEFTDCNVRATSAGTAAFGGAIYTNGNTTILDSTFQFSAATSESGSAGGSAIYHSSGLLDVIRSRFISSNTVGNSDASGAIELAAGITGAVIEDSVFDNNQTSTSAGASFGGAISSRANDSVNVAISRTAFSRHNASTGIAVFIQNGTLRLENSSFYRNFATGGGSFPATIALVGDLRMRHNAFWNNSAHIAQPGGTITGFSGNVFVAPGNTCLLQVMPLGATANFADGSCVGSAGFFNSDVKVESFGTATAAEIVPFISFAPDSPVWDAYGGTGTDINNFNLCAPIDVRLQARPLNDDGDGFSECDAGPAEGRPIVPVFRNGFED